MIGVIYAPKPQESQSTTTTATTATTKEKEREEATRTPGPPAGGGERKMNVVRGEQSMFAKKEPKAAEGEHVGWGTWVWNNVFGGEKKDGTGAGGTVVPAGGGGQSNVVVRALKGLSETVFGF
jgi:hypothetical protein